MDALTYHYMSGTNKLRYVDDAAPSQWSGDIKQQNSANYTYDAIGNLITDASEGNMNIKWNVYGKIKYIISCSKLAI